MSTTAAARCPDCQVAPGEPHEDGCDVARCLITGGQRLICCGGAEIDLSDIFGNNTVIPGHPGGLEACGLDVWSGEWPGLAECRELGWWVRWEPAPPGEQYGRWIPCMEDAPQAQPDLTRLAIDAPWNPETLRHEVRS